MTGPLTQSQIAGVRLRELREATGKSIREVERESAATWGREQRIGKHFLSRLENGQFVGSPDAEMLGRLSDMYGIPIATIYDLFGMRHSRKSPYVIPALERAQGVLAALPEQDREQFIDQLNGMIQEALRKAMQRKRDPRTGGNPEYELKHRRQHQAVLSAE